ADLFLPQAYEQYLPLVNPSHIAMGDSYTAIADENLIYLYERESETYSVYRHLVGNDQTPSAISQVQFTDGGDLYFTDMHNLYHYNFEGHSAEIVHDISPRTFLIHGDYLYMANDSPTSGKVDISYVPLSNLHVDERHTLTDNIDASNPLLAFEDGMLYCIINNNTVIAYSEATHAYVESFELDSSRVQISDLKFVCAHNGNLYYSVNGLDGSKNGIYQTDMHGSARKVIAGNGFSSITAHGDKLYCMQNKSVRELEVTEDGVSFTDFEIAASSPSVNRFYGAVDSVRARDLLVTADELAERLGRVRVYNLET
ncbi:MAG: hypothetical protein K2N74_00265, partial [Clostridiales bacterium]|nr:hypothetical protein [Clostridiales bacterium]